MVVELSYGHIVRLGINEPFIVPEKLEIEFKSIYDLPKLLIVAKQNQTIVKKVVYDAKVDLSELTAQAGVIEISITLINNGSVVKEWEIEPLVVKEIYGTFRLYEYYKSLIESIESNKSNIDTLLDKTNEYIEKHNELAMTVAEIKENY